MNSTPTRSAPSLGMIRAGTLREACTSAILNSDAPSWPTSENVVFAFRLI